MKVDLKRMIKIEDRILQIARDDLQLEFDPVEFDIIPPEKMLEIMAYRSPVNVSNWKFGRDWERIRTIHENVNYGLPYEVVINANPPRAYLMNTNPFAIQILVIAHVIGHCAFFKMNQYFKNSRSDIIEFLSEASSRVDKYEKDYGIDEVERIIDAGHSLQFHSSPFDIETENEKRKRIYKQSILETHVSNKSEFSDITGSKQNGNINEDIALYNQKLWRSLNVKTPVEPTEDILRYIIDNSSVLEDWQKDVLETLRIEGQYYWPVMKTKHMNEGFAVYVHEYIMDKLCKEKMLNAEEASQYNYSNSLVKATHDVGMNPYLIGSKMWENVVDRWDKGRYGSEWENCMDSDEKANWDTKEMGGYKKMLNVMRTYTDWFFMQDFLTEELVRDLKLYVFAIVDYQSHKDYVITRHKCKEIKELIVNSFAHSQMPKVEIVDGNFNNRGDILLEHKWSGSDLDKKFAEETMKHINTLWNRDVIVNTKVNNKEVSYIIKNMLELKKK